MSVAPNSKLYFKCFFLNRIILENVQKMFFSLQFLLKSIGMDRSGSTVGNMLVSHLLFAEDMCVLVPSKHKIVFQCNKTVGVVFTPKKYQQPETPVAFLNDKCVNLTEQVKYLGASLHASRISVTLRGSGVQRSGDAQGDCLIGCPLPNSSIEQWRMVVILTGYSLFVMSQ